MVSGQTTIHTAQLFQVKNQDMRLSRCAPGWVTWPTSWSCPSQCFFGVQSQVMPQNVHCWWLRKLQLPQSTFGEWEHRARAWHPKWPPQSLAWPPFIALRLSLAPPQPHRWCLIGSPHCHSHPAKALPFLVYVLLLLALWHHLKVPGLWGSHRPVLTVPLHMLKVLTNQDQCRFCIRWDLICQWLLNTTAGAFLQQEKQAVNLQGHEAGWHGPSSFHSMCSVAALRMGDSENMMFSFLWMN